MTDTVLVTGASGFIGGHITAELLRRGYAVRGSVRSSRRRGQVHEAMVNAGADPSRLEIRQLDLTSDDGWSDAVTGCRYAIHVASPFVTAKPKDPASLIRPAVEGTKRAVGAALAAGVERIVVTSSLASIQHAPGSHDRVLTAVDWSPSDGRGINAYTASKVRAERAAWDIVDRQDAGERLAVINPGAVIGPLLGDEVGTSVGAIQQIVSGALPMIPDLRMPWVHVKDIADAHIAAMTSPTAAASRTIVASDPTSLTEVARIIRDRLPESASRVPRRSMPTWLTWASSVFESQLRDNRWLIGARQHFDHGPGRALLGRELRPIADAVTETVESLTARGLV